MTSKEKTEAIGLDLLNGTELNVQSIVFLPLGRHEFHGVHASLGTDTIKQSGCSPVSNASCKGMIDIV